MYYELYIDVLFLMNFLMDSIVLLTVKAVLKSPCSFARVFLGGAVGSGLTCLIICIPLPSAIKIILFHTVVSSIMLIIGIKVRGKSEFFKAYLLLYILTFLFGGILQVFRPYLKYASLYFAAAAGSYCMIRMVWSFLSRLSDYEKQICEITVYAEGKKYKIRALTDTGNVLRDEESKEPVCVIDRELAKKIFGEMRPVLGFRYIPYRTIGKCGLMPICRIEKMCIHLQQDRWIERPVIGISEELISEQGEYQMILNPEILGGVEDGCKSRDAAAI